MKLVTGGKGTFSNARHRIRNVDRRKTSQAKNKWSLISEIEAGSVTVASEEQSENALLPMDVTESGMVTSVSPRQNRNAECPMLVTESGIVMDCSEST